MSHIAAHKDLGERPRLPRVIVSTYKDDMLIQAQNRFSSARAASRDSDPRVTVLRDAWRKLHRTLQLLPGNQGVEVVHAARVHARRLRALMRAFRKEANPSIYASLRFDLVNLGRELADVRTADTHLRLLRELSSATRHFNTKDMLTTITLCERRADAARKALFQLVHDSTWMQRIARLESAIGASELLLRRSRPAREECRRLLAGELRETARALRKSNAARVVHKQRIRIKNARYACEQLNSISDAGAERAIQRLILAQDILGDAHDLQSLAQWLENTPIPQALHRPLLRRVKRLERKLVEDFNRRKSSLRHRLQKLARLARDT